MSLRAVGVPDPLRGLETVLPHQPADALLRRPDALEAEGAPWDLARVDAFLARGCWRRQADCDGRISIYGHGRSVGRPWARREMVVRFDASSRCWSVSGPEGAVVKQVAAEELTEEQIRGLAVSRLHQYRGEWGAQCL
jgi:hypothetical protein